MGWHMYTLAKANVRTYICLYMPGSAGAWLKNLRIAAIPPWRILGLSKVDTHKAAALYQLGLVQESIDDKAYQPTCRWSCGVADTWSSELGCSRSPTLQHVRSTPPNPWRQFDYFKLRKFASQGLLHDRLRPCNRVGRRSSPIAGVWYGSISNTFSMWSWIWSQLEIKKVAVLAWAASTSFPSSSSTRSEFEFGNKRVMLFRSTTSVTAGAAGLLLMRRSLLDALSSMQICSFPPKSQLQ